LRLNRFLALIVGSLNFTALLEKKVLSLVRVKRVDCGRQLYYLIALVRKS
jgi:hypothetical protein